MASGSDLVVMMMAFLSIMPLPLLDPSGLSDRSAHCHLFGLASSPHLSGGSRCGRPLFISYSLSLGQRSEEHGGHCGFAIPEKASLEN